MSLATPPPQFSTAEFDQELKDSHGLFGRAVLFGIGGAIAGLILYSTVGIVTGYSIGFVSLAVGWLVGKSMLLGSKNRTGRRYQIVAALLTYAAVSVSAVPIGLYHLIKNPDAINASADATAATPTPNSTDKVAAEPATETTDDESEGSIAGAIGYLLLLGLISPFLELQEMPSGLIGLIILAVGIQIAWKMLASQEAIVQQALAGTAPAGPPDDDKPTSLNIGR